MSASTRGAFLFMSTFILGYAVAEGDWFIIIMTAALIVWLITTHPSNPNHKEHK